jgi:hypothetical protein
VKKKIEKNKEKDDAKHQERLKEKRLKKKR